MDNSFNSLQPAQGSQLQRTHTGLLFTPMEPLNYEQKQYTRIHLPADSCIIDKYNSEYHIYYKHNGILYNKTADFSALGVFLDARPVECARAWVPGHDFVVRGTTAESLGLPAPRQHDQPNQVWDNFFNNLQPANGAEGVLQRTHGGLLFQPINTSSIIIQNIHDHLPNGCCIVDYDMNGYNVYFRQGGIVRMNARGSNFPQILHFLDTNQQECARALVPGRGFVARNAVLPVGLPAPVQHAVVPAPANTLQSHPVNIAFSELGEAILAPAAANPYNRFNYGQGALGAAAHHAPAAPAQGPVAAYLQGLLNAPVAAAGPDPFAQAQLQSLQHQPQDLPREQALGLTHAQVLALQEPLEEGLCTVCMTRRTNVRLGCQHEICNECLLGLNLKKSGENLGYRECQLCRARIVEATRFLKKYTKKLSDKEYEQLYIKYKTKYINLKNKLNK